MNASAFPPLSAPGNDARKDSLITYPSPFPIKVMGARADGFVAAITHRARLKPIPTVPIAPGPDVNRPHVFSSA